MSIWNMFKKKEEITDAVKKIEEEDTYCLSHQGDIISLDWTLHAVRMDSLRWDGSLTLWESRYIFSSFCPGDIAEFDIGGGVEEEWRVSAVLKNIHLRGNPRVFKYIWQVFQVDGAKELNIIDASNGSIIRRSK